MTVPYEERRVREMFAITLDREMTKAKLTCEDLAKRLHGANRHAWSRSRIRRALDCEIDLEIREMADLAFACGFRINFRYEPKDPPGAADTW